jgi:uncharacterized protein YkwD
MRHHLLSLLLAFPGCSDGVLSSSEPVEPGLDARRIGILDGGAAQAERGALPPPLADSTPRQEAAVPLPSPDHGVLPPPPPPPKPDQAVPKPDSSGALGLSAQEKDLLDAINAARAKLGLSTLTVDPMLLCAARLAAQIVPPTGSCGHVGSDGSWPSDRAKKCGMASGPAGYVNEIAAGPGFTDGADAVWGWSQSSGHWWGLTHPKAKTIGVAGTSKGCYWAVFDCCISGSE